MITIPAGVRVLLATRPVDFRKELQLGLESLEQAIAQGEAEAERRDGALKREHAAKRRASRGALPAHRFH